MRDLSVQASNAGSLNTTATASIQKEMGQLKQELDRIANTTTFNGTKLLDGSFNGSVPGGRQRRPDHQRDHRYRDGQRPAWASTASTSPPSVRTARWPPAAPPVPSTTASSAAASVLTVTAQTADAFGASATQSSSRGSPAPSPSPARPWTCRPWTTLGRLDRCLGVGLGPRRRRTAVWGSAASSAFAHTGSGATDSITYGATGGSPCRRLAAAADGSTYTAQDNANATVSFAAGTGASSAITAIDTAITQVSSIRADLGAKQNRFEHTINNLNTTIENTTASESRIRDTDMASEMTSFTRAQVLTQAGTAMLAQANQSTQSILKLLG